MDDLIQRLRAEPTASQFLRIGDLVESLVAERKEAADRIAALEAEKAERERQEPVGVAFEHATPFGPRLMTTPHWNGATSTVKRPLYAHPLALREPTEDECRRIANEFLILDGPDELAGRVMFNAVREVMTK